MTGPSTAIETRIRPELTSTDIRVRPPALKLAVLEPRLTALGTPPTRADTMFPAPCCTSSRLPCDLILVTVSMTFEHSSASRDEMMARLRALVTRIGRIFCPSLPVSSARKSGA